MNTTAPTRPDWANQVEPGDLLTIHPEMATRGGQSGEVLYTSDAGVGLDFYSDADGNQDGAPTQEFWEWTEIDPNKLPLHIS